MINISEDVSYVVDNYSHFIVFLEAKDYSIALKHLIGLDYNPDEDAVLDLVSEFLDKMDLCDEEIDSTTLVVLDSESMKTLYKHFQYGNSITIQ